MADPKKPQSALARLPMAAKIGLGVGLFALIGVAYFVIFYSEVSSKIANAKQQETKLRDDLAQAKDSESAYLRDRAELTDKQQRQRELNKILPETAEYPSFLSAVQQVANVTGVSLNSWDPMDEVPQQFFAKVPMKITLSGRFHQIAKFVYGVGQLDRIINVENIVMNDPKREGDDVNVKTECLTTAFRTLPARPAASGAAPAAPGTPAPPASGAPAAPPATSKLAMAQNRAPKALSRDKKIAATFGVLFTVGALVAGCDDPPAPQTNAPPPPRRASALPSASASASASSGRQFGQEDFTPSDRNRDPFRSYAENFIINKKFDPEKKQIDAIAAAYALDELKLVAIVSAGAQPRAMFVDPQGRGHIVTVGQRLGRSELVKATGNNGPEYDVNWKVDRIREGDVVFVRDTTSSNIPTSSRVVALRVDDPNGRKR